MLSLPAPFGHYPIQPISKKPERVAWMSFVAAEYIIRTVVSFIIGNLRKFAKAIVAVVVLSTLIIGGFYGFQQYQEKIYDPQRISGWLYELDTSHTKIMSDQKLIYQNLTTLIVGLKQIVSLRGWKNFQSSLDDQKIQSQSIANEINSWNVFNLSDKNVSPIWNQYVELKKTLINTNTSKMQLLSYAQCITNNYIELFEQMLTISEKQNGLAASPSKADVSAFYQFFIEVNNKNITTIGNFNKCFEIENNRLDLNTETNQRIIRTNQEFLTARKDRIQAVTKGIESKNQQEYENAINSLEKQGSSLPSILEVSSIINLIEKPYQSIITEQEKVYQASTELTSSTRQLLSESRTALIQ